MSRPLIGISASIMRDNSGIFPNYEREYTNKDYVDAVIQNGGIPFIIPFSTNENITKELVKLIDGLILTGGHDVFPLHYNKEPLQKLGEVFPERDKFDFLLLQESKKKNIPILGVCRGQQIINVYEGGTLYQDLSYIKNKNLLKHVQGHSPEMRTHSIKIEKDTILDEIFEEKSFLVNSFHHQAIENIAETLKITAIAPDGIIEGVEHKTYPFLIGVQWHPEMLFRTYEPMNNIFKKFIEKAKK